MNAIESLRGRVTVLMIAHRLSTLKGCEKIVIMNDSGGCKTGKYEELNRD